MSQPAYDERLDRELEQEEETDAETSAEVEARRAEIEQTRTEMSETIEAIKDKLSPGHLVEQAKEAVRDATVGKAQEAMSNAVDTARGAMDSAKESVRHMGDSAREAVRNVGGRAQDVGEDVFETVRRNPVPFALIGIGIGWLVMNARRDRGYRDFDDRPYGYTAGEYPNDYAPGFDQPRTSGGVREAIGEARGRIGEAAGRVQERAGELADRVQDRAGEMAGQVRERAGEIADRTRERAMDVSERARYQARLATYEVERTWEDNPLAVGAVALVLGAAAGFLLPETRQENRLMGQAKERLVERAQETAQSVMGKVQTVTEQTMDTAHQSAREEGLAA